MRVVVTGANRGIGLELTRQYLDRREVVDAAVRAQERASRLLELAKRHEGRLRVLECDVRDSGSVKRFAESLGDITVDVLINNAGVLGSLTSIDDVDLGDILECFEVNALGPLRMTRAILPLIRRSTIRKIAHITSKMGSISDNTSGGAYGYRMSKAALNMASRSLSRDLRNEGIISVVINPGWVRTAMGGTEAPTSVEDSARGIIREIDRATIADSGEFLDYRGGDRVPW